MMLLIDIGNSRTKYVSLVDGKLSDPSQLNNTDFTSAYFDKHFRQVSRVVVANVAKSGLTSALSTWCQSHQVKFTQVHSERQKDVLTSAYQDPSLLGIDRWLALLGATRLYPEKNVLIIDAGTATTVDFLDEHGQHQGGWILAGINVLLTSILSHSTLVHAENEAEPCLLFGKSTSDNVHNACWAATIGLIHQAIKQAQKYGELDQILVTGGNGKALTLLLESELQESSFKKGNISVKNIKFVDELIFYGLQEYC